ncbi:methyltransferase family protein [Neolewinella antarctica]|uniref:Protein-S-isoprenylcysteine O-methyltransferase Ste14 n=1 Tax=Neolewinella antarctica TaxID=442734 RepID=A0ABX0XF96_9BACT|nr:isoprenylcysteine carboxylmethyltransferase family protein [Neolewinella antarctica]NJC27990.1 protein-S-isoprenylcysteine O-methyltransferase Ste14 [Neolewinella antarctica]
MHPTAYIIQATLISLWWIGLSVSPTLFAAFQFTGIGPVAFKAFLLPDVVMIAGLSVVRAYRESRALEYVILGGFGYASLYCLNASWLTGSGFLPTTVMTLGLAYNLFLVYGNYSFRTSTTTNRGVNGVKTLVQTVCVWFITLGLFPYLIVTAFGTSPTFISGPSFWLAVGMFLLCSVLGLASAFVMVRDGDGTPLPLDQTSRLVIAGSYRYVRNPMAVAGVGQGIAVSLALTSWPVLLYALLGGVLWHCVVRPLEEEDLTRRFGDDYLAYRSRVRCWVPYFGISG